jgi:hypothetical protein
MTKTETETVELTNALLQCLLRMTGNADTEAKRNLSRALHETCWNRLNRWVIEVDEEHIKTIRALIVEYTENHRTRAIWTRFHNYMCQQSDVYRRLYREGAES